MSWMPLVTRLSHRSWIAVSGSAVSKITDSVNRTSSATPVETRSQTTLRTLS